MSLKLNKIIDDVIRENIQDTIFRLEAMMTAPPISPSIDDAIRYYTAIGDDSCNVGLMYYQQEMDRNQIRKFLTQASKLLLQAYMLAEHVRSNCYRSPVEFEKTVALVVCFDDSSLRHSLATIERWKYCSGATLEEESITDFLGVLIEYLGNGQLKRESCLQIIARCSAENASRVQRLFLLPQVQGLVAVSEMDHDSWVSAVNDLLKAHEREAKRGEYRLRYIGLICLPALLLAKIGLERGMNCTVLSPYLPLSLLQE